MNDIQKINQIVTNTLNQTQSNQKVDKNLFKSMLNNVNNLSVQEKETNVLVEQYVTGEIENVHEVLLALEEFQMAVQTTQEVRNKLVEAFNEIKRMQI